MNKTTLDFAVLYSHLLHRANSPLRFSITGENFYYKEYEGHEIEAKFSNPGISNSNNCVFDPLHPSHIVLLIDKNFKDRPKNVVPLSWLHEKSIRIKVFHKKSFGIDKNKFMNRLNQVINKFGFLKLSIADYIAESNKNENIGSCDIELISMISSKPFASEIIYAFKSDICAEIKTINNCVSIIPLSNDAQINEMIHNVEDIKKYSTCISICDEPQTYLPQCLYAYNQFYFVEAYIICKECIINTFKNMAEFQNVINPNTQMIDRMKITNIFISCYLGFYLLIMIISHLMKIIQKYLLDKVFGH